MINILNCALALGIASCVVLYPSIRSNKKADVNNELVYNNVYFYEDSEFLTYFVDSYNMTSDFSSMVNIGSSSQQIFTYTSYIFSDVEDIPPFYVDSFASYFLFSFSPTVDSDSLSYFYATFTGEPDYTLPINENFEDFYFYLNADVLLPERFSFLITLNGYQRLVPTTACSYSWYYGYSFKTLNADNGISYSVYNNLISNDSYYSSLGPSWFHYDSYQLSISIFVNNDTNQGSVYNTGYHDGYVDGYQLGYNVGKNDGINISSYSASNLWMSVVDTPILMIRSLFNFDFFGVNMFVIVAGLLTVLVVLFIVKKVVK